MKSFKVETNFKCPPNDVIDKIIIERQQHKATIETYAQCSSPSQKMHFQALLNRMKQMNREHNSKTIKGRIRNLWMDIKRFFKWNK